MLIIVREPDRGLLEVAREYAMASEASVTLVPHGLDALFWMLHTRIGVVLVEATGGGEDAAAVARVIRSHPVNAAVPVIALIGPEGPEAHGLMRRAGVSEVIAAPPSADAWRKLLRRQAPMPARGAARAVRA